MRRRWYGRFVINCKEIEHTGRLALALHRNELEKTRRWTLTMLVVFRLQSRRTHAKEQAKWNEIRGLKRSMAELAARGVTVSLAELRLRKLQEEREAVEKELAAIGEQILSTLDVWQSLGADFEELCNLCNRDPAWGGDRRGGSGHLLLKARHNLQLGLLSRRRFVRSDGWLFRLSLVMFRLQKRGRQSCMTYGMVYGPAYPPLLPEGGQTLAR